MRINKRILIVGALACVVMAVAGCHSSTAQTYKMRWQSSTDVQKVLEFNLEGHTVVGKLSMVLFSARDKGSYVFKNGDSTTEGRVIQDREGYTLVSGDGKKQRWLLAEDPAYLKDESGTLWKPEQPVKE